MRDVEAFLLDLDGTVYQDGRVIPGVPELVAELSRREVPFAFATNTTSVSRRILSERLSDLGLPHDAVTPDRILTSASVAREHLLSLGIARCNLLVTDALLEDLGSLSRADQDVQAVVVGDIADDFTFARLDRAFSHLRAGAELIALARNRYYRKDGALVLDCGPFVAALEYASGRAATLTGKPSRLFFTRAFELLGVPPSAITVIGDDLESDVGGAQALGARGFLVRTGKFDEATLRASWITPDLVLPSLAALFDRVSS